MDDLILCIVLVLIIGFGIFYIVRAKRRGAKCIGCPHAGACGNKCTCKPKDPENP